jgi:hypothetical protein
MSMKSSGTGGVVTVCGVLLGLAGCAHEVLNVPARSARLGGVSIDQTYAIQQKAKMDVLGGNNGQPKIDLWYFKDHLPPAEAFERVPFPIEAPGADSAWYSTVNLSAGTQISFTTVDVYGNSHVYFGRILNGGSRNTHILLVVPIADARLPSLEELQAEDRAYVIPIHSSAKQPATGPGRGP